MKKYISPETALLRLASDRVLINFSSDLEDFGGILDGDLDGGDPN